MKNGVQWEVEGCHRQLDDHSILRIEEYGKSIDTLAEIRESPCTIFKKRCRGDDLNERKCCYKICFSTNDNKSSVIKKYKPDTCRPCRERVNVHFSQWNRSVSSIEIVRHLRKFFVSEIIQGNNNRSSPNKFLIHEKNEIVAQWKIKWLLMHR